MRYNEFKLNEGFKEVQLKFSQEADPTEVASAFDVFKKLVSANRISGQERNIDWWGKQGWAAFIEYVTAIDERPSGSEQKMRKNKGNSHVIEETAEWLIVVPLDKDASCFHGRNSDWCTTKPTQAHFEQYFRDNSITLIYFFRQADGAMWAMAVSSHDDEAEYFDQQDNPLSSEEFDKQTGLDSDKYIKLVGGSTEVGQKATASRDVMKADLKNLKDLIDKLEQMGAPRRSAKIETMLMKVKDKGSIQKYFRILYDHSGPVEVEQQIQSSVAMSAPSSISWLKGVTTQTVKILEKNVEPRVSMSNLYNPTKQALDYVRSRGLLAAYYAVYRIKGKWPEAEAAIAQDGPGAAIYATRILERKWPEAEAAIASDAAGSLAYVKDIIKERWPPGEAAIATDASSALHYAQNVIDGKWPPGEAAIATDAHAAFIYATEVLDSRFPAAEEVLRKYQDTGEGEEEEFYWGDMYNDYFDL